MARCNAKKREETDLDAPPIIKILEPKQGSVVSNNVLIALDMPTNVNIENKDIQIFIDGNEIEKKVPVVDPSKRGRKFRVTLGNKMQQAKITVIASNKYAESIPVSVDIKIKTTTAVKVSLSILCVGVSDRGLKYAHQDANKFASFFEEHQQRNLYKDVRVKKILNQQATRREILGGLKWLKKEAERKQKALQPHWTIVFFSGHGLIEENDFYFAPFGVSNDLYINGVSKDRILNDLKSVKSDRKILFIDSCYAGQIPKNPLRNEIKDIIIFSSSGTDLVSKESNDLKGSLFTEVLLQGLKGKAAVTNRQKITIQDLKYYIENADLIYNQEPTVYIPATILNFTVVE